MFHVKEYGHNESNIKILFAAATDWFVNLPVRKQFYKNAKQCRDKLRKIEHMMIAFCLVHNCDMVKQ